MPLPASFDRDGLTAPAATRYRRMMIGLEGAANTGKSEFALSAPGPGVFIALDRQYDAMLQNPDPPPTRNADNFVIVPVAAPLVTQAKQDVYLEYWRKFYQIYTTALKNPDARTVVIDGDSDSWELQQLAEYGRLTQIPPIMKTTVNAARRALYARAWDSGKIIISTNKLRKRYETVLDPQGRPVKLDNGQDKREWDGKSYERVGYWDNEYLWQVQLRTLYQPKRVIAVGSKAGTPVPAQWGIKILMCKANRDLEGSELWGADCNLQTLLEYIYPNIPPTDWGFPR